MLGFAMHAFLDFNETGSLIAILFFVQWEASVRDRAPWNGRSQDFVEGGKKRGAKGLFQSIWRVTNALISWLMPWFHVVQFIACSVLQFLCSN